MCNVLRVLFLLQATLVPAPRLRSHPSRKARARRLSPLRRPCSLRALPQPRRAAGLQGPRCSALSRKPNRPGAKLASKWTSGTPRGLRAPSPRGPAGRATGGLCLALYWPERAPASAGSSASRRGRGSRDSPPSAAAAASEPPSASAALAERLGVYVTLGQVRKSFPGYSSNTSNFHANVYFSVRYRRVVAEWGKLAHLPVGTWGDGGAKPH